MACLQTVGGRPATWWNLIRESISLVLVISKRLPHKSWHVTSLRLLACDVFSLHKSCHVTSSQVLRCEKPSDHSNITCASNRLVSYLYSLQRCCCGTQIGLRGHTLLLRLLFFNEGCEAVTDTFWSVVIYLLHAWVKVHSCVLEVKYTCKAAWACV